MIINLVEGTCPNCGEEVEVPFEDLDLYLYRGEVVITFECPACGKHVYNEEMTEAC